MKSFQKRKDPVEKGVKIPSYLNKHIPMCPHQHTITSVTCVLNCEEWEPVSFVKIVSFLVM